MALGNRPTCQRQNTLGSASDTWGHTWTAGQLASSSFRVRVIDLAGSRTRTFLLDSIGVNVTYQ
jgi:hypothetical protein